MKATELMIGDWVCYSKPNGYLTRVDDIRRTGDEKLAMCIPSLVRGIREILCTRRLL